MKSKVTQFIEYLMLHPKRTYKQMQQFFYKLNHPDRDIKTMSNGYYCTNIQTLVYKGHIKKDKNKLYSITKTGIKYKNTPYAQTAKEKRKHSEYLKRREYIEKHYQDLERHDKWTLNRVIERGHVVNIRELIALLKTLPEWLPIELAIDPEINATGPIASTVCVDNLKNPHEAILFPIKTRTT